MTLKRFRWRRRLLIGCSAPVAALVVLLYQPLWAFDLLGWLRPDILWRVPTAAPLVALTFDDGPVPGYTPEVLALLERHQAHATFFMIGEHALWRPDLVAQPRAAGHEIANHYITRRSTWKATDDDFLARLRRTEDILQLREPKLFRPPGGVARTTQLRLAAKDGYICILGSAYPWDPLPVPAGYIEWLAKKNLAPGVIVILHDGIADPTRTIAALEGILQAGKEKGLRFVTVGDLLRAGDGAKPVLH